MSPVTITEFLLARIAEDEAAIRLLLAHEGWYPKGQSAPTSATPAMRVGRWEFTPARVLAECEAKRRIVDEPCPTLLALATVYADHPDYRAEWKP